MRAMSYFYNNNEISIHNSILGVESVRYNGEKMTSKFSIFGAIHDFSVYEDDEHIDYRIDVGMGLTGVTFSIWRNGRALLLGSRSCHNRPHIVSGNSDLV